MLRIISLGTMALVVLAVAWAGGLSIFIGHPSASSDPAAAGGLLLVQVQGCGNTADAKVRATATTKVNGEPKVFPLQVIQLAKPETVILRGDEVKKGDWTVVVTANHLGYEWTATVPLKNGEFDRKTIRQERRLASQATD